MTTKSVVIFERRFPSGAVGRLGVAVYSEHENGWRFRPAVSSRKPSRKAHPTMEGCLPRWVGYPHHCESRYA